VPRRSMSTVPAYLLAVLTACMSIASGQPVGDRQGRQSPFIAGNARAAALGEATGALPGGLEGVSSNPATLAWLNRPHGEYTFHRVSSRASLQHAAAGFPVGTSSAVTVHADMLHYGELDFYTRSALRIRGFELTGGASYATMLSDDLAAGLTVNACNATTDAHPVWAVAADAGLAYQPGRYHSFGFALRGFGTDYRIEHPVLHPDLPDARPTRTVSLAASFDYPLDEDGQRLLLAFENDKMIGRSGLLYKAGVEYQPFPFCSFRGGVQVRGNDVEPRGGLGAAIGPLAVDYAYRYRSGNGPSHVFTLSYSRR
jgi:hypothetical protein